MIIPSQDFLNHFMGIPGALSVAESICIINIAASAPKGGLWCEGGTHKGKSASSALYGGSPEEFHLIDTEFEKTINVSDVKRNVSKFVNSKVNIAFLIGEFKEYLKESKGMYSFVFSDAGLHDDEVMEEMKLLEDKVIPNGIICMHDCGNQFTAVQRSYDYLVSTKKYEPIEINWQPILDYVKENNLEEGNVSWHQYPELPHSPNFVGALRRK